MSDAQSIEISKLEKLRSAWLPAVEFLFGEAAPEAEFVGFEMNPESAKPVALFENETAPYQYKIQMPARSFSNDVMLLADVIQEMVRGLFPAPEQDHNSTTLCEGTVIYGAIMAIKQVFGEESVDSYLNALREKVPAYYDAFSYVAVLLTEDPQAIKKLRAVQPLLYKATKEDFDTADIEINRKVKDILLLTFRA
ncbi:hypothetical protein [Marinomonas pollencensis]|uniref:Uncharacterized protein n=1 Tax=Marinomonas pollencensis TaxID=491954 RepID=A0A3E0DU36_9GAMM|nr:hypothetical protein [Marinomonas pollencensis]REG86950.1 hypothetical protein DFP81_101520 [Marinomonas pollencensis]